MAPASSSDCLQSIDQLYQLFGKLMLSTDRNSSDLSQIATEQAMMVTYSHMNTEVLSAAKCNLNSSKHIRG